MKILSKLLWYSLSENERYQWLQLVPAIKRSQIERMMKGKGASYPESFYEKKCIFVHIPKTAGTSITSVLFGRPRPGHQPLTWYESIDRDASESFFKFAFVRNPWDRLVSSYHYMRSKKSLKVESSDWVNFVNGFDNFDDFVINWVNEDNVNLNITFMPQYKFVLNKFGLIGLDYIGRFESIQNDFSHICNVLNVDCKLSHENRSERNHYSNYYNDKTRDIVAKAYRKDIEMFEYEF